MNEQRAPSHYQVWLDVPTRWADNDLYGHINNAAYYGFFDTAVNTMLIERAGLDIHNGAVIGLVVETGCSYFRPLAYPGPVRVGLTVAQIGNSSVRYELGVFPAEADLPAAQGHFVHVYVDRDTRRPVPVPDSMRCLLEAFHA